MDELKTTNIEVSGCKKDGKSIEDINKLFNADDICMKCENILYKDGVISCKYSRVN